MEDTKEIRIGVVLLSAVLAEVIEEMARDDPARKEAMRARLTRIQGLMDAAHPGSKIVAALMPMFAKQVQ